MLPRKLRTNPQFPRHSREPFAHLGRIENAGEILLGDATPILLGNFVLGPNAVLPTGRNARTWSALSVFDYLKRTSVGYVTRDGYKALAPHAHRLAVYEGFYAHVMSDKQHGRDRQPSWPPASVVGRA